MVINRRYFNQDTELIDFTIDGHFNTMPVSIFNTKYKVYNIKDLTPHNQLSLLSGKLHVKVITKSHLISSKRAYCYTLKYKGCKVYFEHDNQIIELIC